VADLPAGAAGAGSNRRIPGGRSAGDATGGWAPAGDRLEAIRVVVPEPHRVELEQTTVGLTALEPHEVVVRARSSVISPGTELAHYRGDSLEGVLPHAQRPGEPFYPGYAMVGSVLAAGSECGLAAGATVLSHTPHQSVVRFDRRRRVCVPVPDGLDVAVAPFARLAQVGGVSLQLSAARPGDAVAVIGLGPVGNLVAQLAQASGYRVVAVESSPARRELARVSGLRRVVAPEEAAAALAPHGAALVLECSGRQAAVLLSTELCARHGEVMTVGAPWRPEPEAPASALVARVFERFLALRSGWEWQVPLYGEGRSVASCTQWVLERLADGSVTTAALTSGTVAPAQARDAYALLDREPERHVTFLIDWQLER
jgi:2-desacetyl-2-hydroxyethyl bacteriochlorophyllide A dehydrogenase